MDGPLGGHLDGPLGEDFGQGVGPRCCWTDICMDRRRRFGQGVGQRFGADSVGALGGDLDGRLGGDLDGSLDGDLDGPLDGDLHGDGPLDGDLDCEGWRPEDRRPCRGSSGFYCKFRTAH